MVKFCVFIYVDDVDIDNMKLAYNDFEFVSFILLKIILSQNGYSFRKHFKDDLLAGMGEITP